MVSGLCSWCMCLWTAILFRSTFADSASLQRYTMPDYQTTFEEALRSCDAGFLTTFATKQEVDKILSLISKSGFHQNNFTFWVGLRKEKPLCTVHERPLRGFLWTETLREDSEGTHWAEEPQDTCLSTFCAAVRVDFDGSKVMRWGLISVSCKNKYRFVCKLREGLKRPTPEHRETSTKPATPEPKQATSEPNSLTPKKPNTEPGTPEPKLLTQLETEVLKPTSRPKQIRPDPGLGSEPALGSHSCTHPIIPESRSLSPDLDNNRIQVKCWSSDQLELHCQGHPAMWRLPDNSPANFSTICQRCGAGFQKDAFANCVDIDECSNGHAHCKHTCLNTKGSYRCICPDGTDKDHGEDSVACTESVTVENDGPLSKTVIQVLIAVGILVVLLVVVMVTVKCCLMRKSKKKKTAKKVMKNKDSEDSFSTANERTER